eukprot:1158619-Pelagomonas_calceolata.AAC.7
MRGAWDAAKKVAESGRDGVLQRTFLQGKWLHEGGMGYCEESGRMREGRNKCHCRREGGLVCACFVLSTSLSSVPAGNPTQVTIAPRRWKRQCVCGVQCVCAVKCICAVKCACAVKCVCAVKCMCAAKCVCAVKCVCTSSACVLSSACVPSSACVSPRSDELGCTLCGVKCNSRTTLDQHLSSRKHLAKVANPPHMHTALFSLRAHCTKRSNVLIHTLHCAGKPWQCSTQLSVLSLLPPPLVHCP